MNLKDIEELQDYEVTAPQSLVLKMQLDYIKKHNEIKPSDCEIMPVDNGKYLAIRLLDGEKSYRLINQGNYSDQSVSCNVMSVATFLTALNHASWKLSEDSVVNINVVKQMSEDFYQLRNICFFCLHPKEVTQVVIALD